MNKFRKNQIVIYSIVLMLVIAGYLNYIENDKVIEISTNTQNDTNIGDAKLVSNNEIAGDNDANFVSNEENEIIDTDTEKLDKQDTIDTNSDTATDEEDEYFTNSKLEREKMYSQMVETYQKILENTSVSEEQKSIATTEITKINNIRNAIMICENLIELKGFKKVVILANGESVNVVVKSEKLKGEEIAQIQNIISREMKTSIENIHIMKK